jgi:hypothetical protein
LRIAKIAVCLPGIVATFYAITVEFLQDAGNSFRDVCIHEILLKKVKNIVVPYGEL